VKKYIYLNVKKEKRPFIWTAILSHSLCF